ncbi:MAG: O-succinylhomoserine sulfhydrylase [Alphaproteobacteria bacterium]|nr:O-succinylhomoserine sulfhydrylase [Alphaproteobacteria bacterium]
MDKTTDQGAPAASAEPVFRARTAAVRGGLKRSGFNETSEALYLTSGYVYGSAAEAEAAFAKPTPGRFVYSRFANPTVATFEERLRQMEGAEACRATATGMAAVFAALMSLLRAGDRIVASRALFGSCHVICAEILPRFGVISEFVDGSDKQAWERALSKPAKAVFLETPSNPMLEIIDLPFVVGLARKAGAQVVVDNVFATPLLQRPIEMGADVVVYSATKHIDGQGRCLGGAILCRRELSDGDLGQFLRHTGPAMSPFNAWNLLKGLETLPLRVEAMCRAALTVARFLEGRGGVKRTLYPQLASHPQAALAQAQMALGGSVVTFEVEGGKDAAFRFLDALELIDISNNLGDSKSLVCHSATTTHQRLTPADRLKVGITDGVLRLSVGLEDELDIIDDLKRGLAAV